MKNVFRMIFYFALCGLIIACTQQMPMVSPEPKLIPSLPATVTAEPMTIASPPATSAAEPTYSSPTLVPVIEKEEAPKLLKAAISLQLLDALNGHEFWRITGWESGFRRGVWNDAGYQWMDANHLLLFPVIGETQQPNWTTTYTYATVLDFDSGSLWFPPMDRPHEENRSKRISLPRWSPKLGLLITAENTDPGNSASEGVSTYRPDGIFVAHYNGPLIDTSPSGTKILIAEDTWIDLESGKTVDFSWGEGLPTERWLPIWSRDETQVYRCCYFYGNAKTGESCTISEESTILEGHSDTTGLQSLWHSRGNWLGDRYVLAQFDAFHSYRDGFIPIFDTSARTFLNLGALADLPDEFNNYPQTEPHVSPNMDYLWLDRGYTSTTDPQAYVVDLETFTSEQYPADEVIWSANGEYAIIGSQVLTLSDKTHSQLPSYPGNQYHSDDVWHPTKGVFASLKSSEDQTTQNLFVIDVETMTLEQVELPPAFSRASSPPFMFWSPSGDHIALLAEDLSLWQTDYPKLETFEQLTAPLPNARNALWSNVLWSPDGTFLSFISGTDIYIVDTRSNP